MLSLCLQPLPQGAADPSSIIQSITTPNVLFMGFVEPFQGQKVKARLNWFVFITSKKYLCSNESLFLEDILTPDSSRWPNTCIQVFLSVGLSAADLSNLYSSKEFSWTQLSTLWVLWSSFCLLVSPPPPQPSLMLLSEFLSQKSAIKYNLLIL